MSNYVTAIGLDVHARSIKACALNPMTGEVERASFGYDPASVAEWALGFESPMFVASKMLTKGTAVGILDQNHPMLLGPNPFDTAWGSCNPGRPLS